MNHAVLLAAGLALTGSAAAWGLEAEFGSHGYVRAGQGVSSGGSQRECFRAPGAGAKYRLGNECEVWSELVGYATFRDRSDGPFFHVQGMTSLYGPNEQAIDFDRTQEAFVEVGGLGLGGAKFWLGRRYYDRKDIHINDYLFLNMSGDGIGVRDWDWGFGKFAYAYTRERFPALAGTPVQHSHDFRLYDLPVNRGGKLFLFANYAPLDGDVDVQDADGYALSLIHTQENVLGGTNTLALQYGTGTARKAGAGMGVGAEVLAQLTSASAVSRLEDGQTWRLINQTVFDFQHWAILGVVIYERKNFSEFDATDQTWLSFGLRPMWFFHKNMRLTSELGYDQVEDQQADQDGALTKLTLALEFAEQPGFWKRPVLRLFATHAWWSEAWQGRVGGDTYATNTSGWNVGVQVEHWW